MRTSSIEQSKSYLPTAQKDWNKEARLGVIQSKTEPAGTFLGIISIPSINKSVNIFQGTTNSQLAKGVGHFIQSVMPGVADNSVLAGHRDTVFSHLGLVKIGAYLVVTVQSGTYIYQVNKIRIVDKNDLTVIVPTKVATLTLSTCYPFIFFGNAPRRYIVSAVLIDLNNGAANSTLDTTTNINL